MTPRSLVPDVGPWEQFVLVQPTGVLRSRLLVTMQVAHSDQFHLEFPRWHQFLTLLSPIGTTNEVIYSAF